MLEMEAGNILYIPLGWAHRTVNDGPDDLVFLSVWPPSTEYDYETVRERGGFPIRFVEKNNLAVTVENSGFHRF